MVNCVLFGCIMTKKVTLMAVNKACQAWFSSRKFVNSDPLALLDASKQGNGKSQGTYPTGAVSKGLPVREWAENLRSSDSRPRG